MEGSLGLEEDLFEGSRNTMSDFAPPQNAEGYFCFGSMRFDEWDAPPNSLNAAANTLASDGTNPENSRQSDPETAQRERLDEAERIVTALRTEVSDSRRKLHAVGQTASETNNSIQSKERQLSHAVAARHDSDIIDLPRQLQEARHAAAENRRRVEESETVYDESLRREFLRNDEAKREMQELTTEDITRSAQPPAANPLASTNPVEEKCVQLIFKVLQIRKL